MTIVHRRKSIQRCPPACQHVDDVIRCGHGVPESELEQIFEPFHRVADARERHSGGEGVGLAIAARVARIHGGRIEAGNREGGGAYFRVILPAGGDEDE